MRDTPMAPPPIKTSASMPRQYGQEIIEPGEGFSELTLQAIQDIVGEEEASGEAEAKAQPTDANEDEPESQEEDSRPSGPRGGASTKTARAVLQLVSQDQVIDDPEEPEFRPVPTARIGTGGQENSSLVTQQVQADMLSELAAQGAQRRLPIKSGTWRLRILIRRLWTSPRMLSLVVLATVVIWKPWFIPQLVLCLFLCVLLVAILCGTHRIRRIGRYVVGLWVGKSPQRRLQLIRVQSGRRAALRWLVSHLPEGWAHDLGIESLANPVPPTPDSVLQDRLSRMSSDY